MKLHSMALALLALAASQPALADNQRGFYAGAGFALVSEDHGGGINKDLDGIDRRYRMGNLFAGYKYNAALGMEVRYGAGLQSGHSDVPFPDGSAVLDNAVQADVKVRVEDYQSIYYRPELTNEGTKTYGLLGYTRMSVSGRATGPEGTTLLEREQTEGGVSYGLGIGFEIQPQINLNFEYLAVLEHGGNRLATLGASLDYRF